LSNYSSSGEAYFYTYLKAKKIIPNNKQIKAVFIEMENGQIEKRMDNWTWGDAFLKHRFPLYFPIMNFKELKFLWNKNSNAIIKCAPKSFINEISLTYINTFFMSKGAKSNNRFGGYKFLVHNLTDSLININKNFDETNGLQVNCEISETNIVYLGKIVELCNQNNVKVFFIRSPVLSKLINWGNEPILKQLLKSKFSDIEYLDFKDFPINKSNFADFSHLNYKGAKVFSIFFNNLLKSDLLQKKDKQKFINDQISKRNNNSLEFP